MKQKQFLKIPAQFKLIMIIWITANDMPENNGAVDLESLSNENSDNDVTSMDTLSSAQFNIKSPIEQNSGDLISDDDFTEAESSAVSSPIATDDELESFPLLPK